MIIVYFTSKDMEEAKRISRHLVEKRLVACANIIPIESIYAWEGEVVDESEVAVLCKSRDDNFLAVEKEIRSLHSYEVPMIYSWRAGSVSRDYASWVDKSTENAD